MKQILKKTGLKFSFSLPVDTIVYIDGYGYAENKIYWYINYWSGFIVNTGSTGGRSPNFYVNGLIRQGSRSNISTVTSVQHWQVLFKRFFRYALAKK